MNMFKKLLTSLVIHAIALGFMIYESTAHPTNEVWVSDQAIGSNLGTLEHPYDASTQVKFDTVMSNLTQNAGMTIHLLPGIYLTKGYHAGHPSNWVLRANSTLTGAGMNATIIKLIDNSPLNMGPLNSLPGTSNITVKDLTFDCNGANAITNNKVVNGATVYYQTVQGPSLNGEYCSYIRVKVKNVIGWKSASAEAYGLGIRTYNSDHTLNLLGKGGLISECISESPLGDYVSGFLITGGGIVENSYAFMPPYEQLGGNFGINAPDSNGLIVQNCYIEGGDAGVYTDYGGVTNLVVRNNVIRNVVRGISYHPNEQKSTNLNGIIDGDTLVANGNIIEINPNTTSRWMFGIACSPTDYAQNYSAFNNVIKWTPEKNSTNGLTNLVYGFNAWYSLGITVSFNSIASDFFWYGGHWTNLNRWNNFTITGSLFPSGDTYQSGVYSGTLNQVWPSTGKERRTVSASTTLQNFDHHLGVTTTGAVTVTLPSAGGTSGKVFVISSEASSANITIAPASGEKINGVAANKSHTTGYSSTMLISNGSDGWFTF
ncbi:MAG: hypothetical protein SFY81_05665 [Verrucomicrobiota bacterium]|nr:hypothetical protein [Verrucomicrobiota bacterium]